MNFFLIFQHFSAIRWKSWKFLWNLWPENGCPEMSTLDRWKSWNPENEKQKFLIKKMLCNNFCLFISVRSRFGRTFMLAYFFRIALKLLTYFWQDSNFDATCGKIFLWKYFFSIFPLGWLMWFNFKLLLIIGNYVI